MHRHNLPCNQGKDLVVNWTVVVADSSNDLAYSHTLLTKDEAPAILGDMFASGLYAWEIQARLPISTAMGSGQGYHGGQSGSGGDN